MWRLGVVDTDAFGHHLGCSEGAITFGCLAEIDGVTMLRVSVAIKGPFVGLVETGEQQVAGAEGDVAAAGLGCPPFRSLLRRHGTYQVKRVGQVAVAEATDAAEGWSLRPANQIGGPPGWRGGGCIGTSSNGP